MFLRQELLLSQLVKIPGLQRKHHVSFYRLTSDGSGVVISILNLTEETQNAIANLRKSATKNGKTIFAQIYANPVNRAVHYRG